MKDKYQTEKRELFNIWLRRCPTRLDVAVALHKANEYALERSIADKYNLLPQLAANAQTDSSYIESEGIDRLTPYMSVSP